MDDNKRTAKTIHFYDESLKNLNTNKKRLGFKSDSAVVRKVLEESAQLKGGVNR